MLNVLFGNLRSILNQSGRIDYEPLADLFHYYRGNRQEMEEVMVPILKAHFQDQTWSSYQRRQSYSNLRLIAGQLSPQYSLQRINEAYFYEEGWDRSDEQVLDNFVTSLLLGFNIPIGRFSERREEFLTVPSRMLLPLKSSYCVAYYASEVYLHRPRKYTGISRFTIGDGTTDRYLQLLYQRQKGFDTATPEQQRMLKHFNLTALLSFDAGCTIRDSIRFSPLQLEAIHHEIEKEDDEHDR